MACATMQNDRSLERPERWKRHFLKTNGMRYFAERQEPRAPRKMETPLSEDQCATLQNDRSLERPERWKRHFLKANGMCYFAEQQEPRAPRKMETPFSEDQCHAMFYVLWKTTGAPSAQKDGNATF